MIFEPEQTPLLVNLLEKLKERGKKIVFANGCFDVIHLGHMKMLEEARGFGDVLVVAVNSDSSVTRLKGETRPVFPEGYRMEFLEMLSCVDFVVTFTEDDPENLIRLLVPDVMVKAEDWKGKEVAGAKFVEENGGRMVFLPLIGNYSSTNIIERIHDATREGVKSA